MQFHSSLKQLPTQGQGLDNLQCKESILFERGKRKNQDLSFLSWAQLFSSILNGTGRK
jgi:hypothetical protein